MLLSNIKTFAAAALVFSVLGCIAWGVGLRREGQDRNSVKGPATAPASNTPRFKAMKPSDSETTISYEGRVLDAGGRPFSGAEIYLIGYGVKQPENPPVRATSGTDGRFRFAAPKPDLDAPDYGVLWPSTTVVARATGFAFGMANDHRGDGKELTLQLVADDVPVRAGSLTWRVGPLRVSL